MHAVSDSDGLERGRVVAIARIRPQACLILDEVLVAAREYCGIEAQRIHAAAQANSKVLLFRLEIRGWECSCRT